MANGMPKIIITFDPVKTQQVISKYTSIYMDKAVKRLIAILEQEAIMHQDGGGPGHSDWRKQIASNMKEVQRNITQTIQEYWVGYDSDDTVRGDLMAYIVMHGVGAGAGGATLTAGPTGRPVFDGDLGIKRSEAKSVYALPNFDQKGNEWLQSAADIFGKEFPDIIGEIAYSIPRAEVVACAIVATM